MSSHHHPFCCPRIVTQIVLFVVCFIFSLQLVFTASSILPDYVNNLIHEAGHILFSHFGQAMYVAGGSLLQITIPLMALLHCFMFRKKFLTALSVFWVGNNLINIALYIGDAQRMELELTGIYHDWNWLLRSSDLIEYTSLISTCVFTLGIFSLFTSLVMMYTYILYQFRDYYFSQHYKIRQSNLIMKSK